MPNPWPARVTAWYRDNQRSLPWRTSRSPYHIWISEIMAQQTRIDTVIPYYERFIVAFPSVTALARAPLQSVLKQWEGLGYYSRARNLHRAAKLVVSRYGCEVPRDYDTLLSLPGFGPYTAAAVASFAFGAPIPVVDGNVLRVFTRFFGIAEDIRKPSTRNALFERLSPAIQTVDVSAFNQGIMELGALVCTPRNPDCAGCPLKRDCIALRDGRIAELPVKSKAAKIPHVDVGVGIIWRRGRILIAKRREDQMLGGLWELPGGKRRAKEPFEETVRREVREETGLDVTVGARCDTVEHTYSHFKITLRAYHCDAPRGRPKAHVADEVRWVHPDALFDYPFPKASLRVIETLRAERGAPSRA